MEDLVCNVCSVELGKCVRLYLYSELEGVIRLSFRAQIFLLFRD